MVQWWFTHVAAPVQHARSPVAFLQKLEGTSLLPMPDGMASSSSAPPSSGQTAYAPSNSGRKKSNRSKGSRPTNPPAPYAPAEPSHGKNKGKGKGSKKGHDGKGKKGAKSSNK